jgi:hypothetical protein
MRLRASWPKLLGLASAFLVVVVIAAAGFFYIQVQNLPLYEDGEQVPVDGIAVNSLKQGDSIYISGPFEFSLEVIEGQFDIPLARRIGKTSQGLDIYKPVGHDGSRYVFTRGEMNADSVYRNSSTPQVSLSDLDVNAMEYINDYGGSPTSKRTNDKDLIRDLVTTLTSGAGLPANPSKPHNIYHVRLFSDQLPGLAYFAYVIVDDRGDIYLTHRAMEDQLWIPVDDRLSQWLRPTS